MVTVRPPHRRRLQASGALGLGDPQAFVFPRLRGSVGPSDQQMPTRAGCRLLQGRRCRAMGWVSHDASGTFMARGVHGQSLWIDPAAGVVTPLRQHSPESAGSPAQR